MTDKEKVIKGLEAIVNDDWMWKNAAYCAGICKDALALLKAQEHPTDECIRNAVFCLQNPHDCLETEVEEARKMSLYALKARELKMVTGVAEMYKDILVGNCPSCDQTIVSNVKKPTKYCRFCGQRVTFE